MFKVDLTASIDELEQGLLAREQAISSIRQQQAEMLRALDVMQVDRVDGARSLQEWTRGRLDVSAHTARDLVDAARALPEQPNLVQNAEGLSFERLVATSRLVASGASEATIRESLGFDIEGIGRLRNRHRRISRRSERDVYVDRHVYLQDSFDGSRGRVQSELPGFEYQILAKALEERADMFGDLPDRALPSRSGWPMRWSRLLRTRWNCQHPTAKPRIGPIRWRLCLLTLSWQTVARVKLVPRSSLGQK